MPERPFGRSYDRPKPYPHISEARISGWISPRHPDAPIQISKQRGSTYFVCFTKAISSMQK